MADKFILTPGGYRRASTVREIREDSVVRDMQGYAQLLDGNNQVLMHVADAIDPVAAVPASNPGWVADAAYQNTSGAPIQIFASTWIVPNPPSQNDNQLIYLFNGLEQAANSPGILQPVLQWGYSDYGGGPFWSVASWYVMPDNSAFRTPLIPVNPGTVLTGRMTLTGQGGGVFNYDCEFVGIAGTTLHASSISELAWCYETLEAYNITGNVDYPVDPSVRFSNIPIQTTAGALAVNWAAAPPAATGQRTVIVPPAQGNAALVDLYFR